MPRIKASESEIIRALEIFLSNIHPCISNRGEIHWFFNGCSVSARTILKNAGFKNYGRNNYNNIALLLERRGILGSSCRGLNVNLDWSNDTTKPFYIKENGTVVMSHRFEAALLGLVETSTEINGRTKIELRIVNPAEKLFQIGVFTSLEEAEEAISSLESLGIIKELFSGTRKEREITTYLFVQGTFDKLNVEIVNPPDDKNWTLHRMNELMDRASIIENQKWQLWNKQRELEAEAKEIAEKQLSAQRNIILERMKAVIFSR